MSYDSWDAFNDGKNMGFQVGGILGFFLGVAVTCGFIVLVI